MMIGSQVLDAVWRRLSSHNRHGNVTVYLRGRHLFVTRGCNGAVKRNQKS